MAATGATKAGGKSRARTSQKRKETSSQRASDQQSSAMDMTPPDQTSSRRSQTQAKSRAGSKAATSRAASGRAGAEGAGKAEAKTPARSGARTASTKGGARGASKSATGRSQARATAAKGGQDALQFLKQDHRAVDALFSEFEEAKDGRTRSSIMRRIAQMLTVHTQIEEEIFYPAARQELDEQDLLNEAQVEHDSLKKLIAEIEEMRPSEQLYKAKVTVLKEYVKHHVKEEEREMFPLVKKTGLDLEALGEELASRKEQLMKQGGAGRGRGRRQQAETPAAQARS